MNVVKKQLTLRLLFLNS